MPTKYNHKIERKQVSNLKLLYIITKFKKLNNMQIERNQVSNLKLLDIITNSKNLNNMKTAAIFFSTYFSILKAISNSASKFV